MAPQSKRSALRSVSEWERDAVILPLQRLLRPVDFVSQLLGSSVQGEAILPLFATLYWCLDQHKCVAGIWLVPLSEIANGVAKWLTRRPRPAWDDERVRLLAWSTEFSFPSSHSQLVFAIAHFMVAASAHPQAVTETPAFPCYMYAALVALSRVHVGLHYPSDVVVGGAWGYLTSALYDCFLPRLLEMALGSPAQQLQQPMPPSATSSLHLLGLLSIPLLLSAVAVTLAYRQSLKSKREDDVSWKRRACQGKYATRELDPRGIPLGSYTGMLGVLAGLAIGEACKQHTPLAYPSSRRNAWLRAILGNTGLLAMFVAISEATPKKPFALYHSLRFLRYAMVPIYILLLAPPAFKLAGI